MATLTGAKNMSSKGLEISAQFANLDRDYDLVHKTYQDLLARRESAKLSQSVNDEQSSINVRIVEPPKKAPFPVSPNRPLLNSAIILLGLAAGIATAIGLSWRRSSTIPSSAWSAAWPAQTTIWTPGAPIPRWQLARDFCYAGILSC
jgi:uncharacterized protein involved in exopolysaccharide biosynthesis